MEKQLRKGYTTGSCASAAAMASAIFLLGELQGERRGIHDSDSIREKGSQKKEALQLPEWVRISLGNGQEADFFPEYGKKPVRQEEGERPEKQKTTAEWEPSKTPETPEEPETPAEWGLPAEPGKTEAERNPGNRKDAESWCRVKKNAGDDPDVTDGVWVYAGVFPVTGKEFQDLCQRGAGYQLPEYPKLYLNGGPGIGIATREGLSCPVGHYAINPVPRKGILKAVERVRRERCYPGYLEVRIAIPAGIRLAEKTFNPRLGILGGISVLGTTGIVEPMSEEALLETIRLDIRMKRRGGEPVLLLTPGNYGEAFLKEELGVALGEAVKCSNFIGASVDFAREEGFSKLLLAGHIGKLVKVTGGVRNTHSRYGDGRMELLERLVRRVQKERVETVLAERIKAANTTEEAVGWLKEAGIAQAVLDEAARAVKEQISGWIGEKPEAEVVVFSSTHGVVGKTSQAEEFLCLWKGRV